MNTNNTTTHYIKYNYRDTLHTKSILFLVHVLSCMHALFLLISKIKIFNIKYEIVICNSQQIL